MMISSIHPSKVSAYIVSVMMMLWLNQSLYSQEAKKIRFPERAFGLTTGFSHHQSQKLNGFNLGLNHQISIGKKMMFHNDILFTIQAGYETTHNTVLSGFSIPTAINPWFRSTPLKYMTAGIQTSAGISLSMLKGKIKTGTAVMIRYQTTSRPEKYIFNVDVVQTTSGPLYSTNYVINSIRPHTFAAGAMVFADIHLFKTKILETKGNLSFQWDSRGDRIFGAGIKLQKSYKKTS
jgi:hypothetical protein